MLLRRLVALVDTDRHLGSEQVGCAEIGMKLLLEWFSSSLVRLTQACKQVCLAIRIRPSLAAGFLSLSRFKRWFSFKIRFHSASWHLHQYLVSFVDKNWKSQSWSELIHTASIAWNGSCLGFLALSTRWSSIWMGKGTKLECSSANVWLASVVSIRKAFYATLGDVWKLHAILDWLLSLWRSLAC